MTARATSRSSRSTSPPPMAPVNSTSADRHRPRRPRRRLRPRHPGQPPRRTVAIFVNDGKAKFSDGTEDNYPPKVGAYTYNVEACDFDEDERPRSPARQRRRLRRVRVRHRRGGHHLPPLQGQVLVNDGSGHFTDETEETISGEPAADDNAVKCADVTGDGHYDLIVASLTNIGEKLLINDGNAKFSHVEGGFPELRPPRKAATPSRDPTLGIDVADVDGDGVLDVITGQGEGAPARRSHLQGQRRSGADVTEPSFRAFETPVARRGARRRALRRHRRVHQRDRAAREGRVLDLQSRQRRRRDRGDTRFVGGDLFRAVIPPAGCRREDRDQRSATDRWSSPARLIVDRDHRARGPRTDRRGRRRKRGRAATAARANRRAAAAGGTTTDPEEGGAGGEPSSGGTSSKGATSGDEDDGCGCSVPGAPSGEYGAVSALVLAGLALRRRRARA